MREKKTINLDIWDILDYRDEDYLLLIHEAGFEAEKEHMKFGRFLEKAEYKQKVKNKRRELNKFREFIRSSNILAQFENNPSLMGAYNKLDNLDAIDEEELKKDFALAELYKNFLAEGENGLQDE